MDHHTVAAISIAGTITDVFGGLYLAYDLLGGQHGPLRLLTRAVTYSLIFGVGYGLGWGLWFGLTSGLATGITAAVELNRVARRNEHYGMAWEALFSSTRGAGFSLGLYPHVGLSFAAVFGILSTLGQIVAYSRGIRPSMDYMASRRPRFTRTQFWGTVVRTIGYMVAALACSALIHRLAHALVFAMRLGLVTGLTTTIGSAINPYIEYYADNLPERRLGAIGVGLILCGFALQSLQYWLALFDVRVI